MMGTGAYDPWSAGFKFMEVAEITSSLGLRTRADKHGCKKDSDW